MPWEKRPGVEPGTEMGLLAERTGLFPKRQVALLDPPGPSLCAPAVCKQVPTSCSPAPPVGVLGVASCTTGRRAVSGESWAAEQTGDGTAFSGGEPLLLRCVNCEEPANPSPFSLHIRWISQGSLEKTSQ